MVAEKNVGYKMKEMKKGLSKEIDGIHIFKHVMVDGECRNPSAKSLCGRVKFADVVDCPGVGCLSEEDMRQTAAEIGRAVCGQCAGALSADKD